MIEHTVPEWQLRLAESSRDAAELARRLQLDPSNLKLPANDAGFRLRVTDAYLGRIRAGDPDDPLLRQILPNPLELEQPPGYTADPLGEIAAMARPGLLHKYSGRVLLTLTSACGIHCRYCFRRHFPYSDARVSRDQWREALDYIAADDSIHEVIFSGGDPLSLADHRLRELVQALQAIPHLQRLRLHTRLPVVLPERVTADLLQWIDDCRLPVVTVLHINHANEIDAAVRRVAGSLKQVSSQLLNQAVLLKGVNDDPRILHALSIALFDAGILPYYLHLLDPVQGAAHFAVSATDSARIYAAVRASLPGYLLPRLVREQALAPAKLPAETADW